MEYRLREITPEKMQCGWGACPSIYLVEKTPENMQCGVGACPSIYSAEKTPEKMQCGGALCPSVHESDGNYLIVGKQVNPAEVGLEKKVGDGEVLISVPKGLIDGMERTSK